MGDVAERLLEDELATQVRGLGQRHAVTGYRPVLERERCDHRGCTEEADADRQRRSSAIPLAGSRSMGGSPKTSGESASIVWPVDNGPMTSPDVSTSSGGDFTERLVEAFFRRWFLYLVPVVLLAAVGVRSASGLEGEFESSARLSATSNPYVYQPDIRGTQIEYYESAASGTARLVNEQLQTDAFIDDIAERAGLGDAVDSGTRHPWRHQVSECMRVTQAGATSVFAAFWDDPTTALMLVEATISGYREYLDDLAAADSSEAIEFWSKQKQDAVADVNLAEAELTNYVEQLPPLQAGEERPTEQVLEIQRLNSAIDRALDAEREAQAAIDEAEFAAAQALSNSARELLLIDPPSGGHGA